MLPREAGAFERASFPPLTRKALHVILFRQVNSRVRGALAAILYYVGGLQGGGVGKHDTAAAL
jgi:hypothetical protein